MRWENAQGMPGHVRAQRRGRRPPLTVLGHSQLGLSLMTLLKGDNFGSPMTRGGRACMSAALYLLYSVDLAFVSLRSSLRSSFTRRPRPALSGTTLVPTIPLLLLHVATANASLANFKPVVA